jgi:4-carboxymuconolactone decarboxylase
MSSPIRFPPIEHDALSPAQREAVGEIIAGPRGKFGGPFVPLLRSPHLLQVCQQVGVYLRYRSPLPDSLREFATLLVVRRWEASSEWDVHAPLALMAGNSPAVISDLAEKRRPSGASLEALAVHDLVVELLETRFVSPTTYNAALDVLGEEQLMDVVGVCGYYIQLSLVINLNQGARTPRVFNVAQPQ